VETTQNLPKINSANKTVCILGAGISGLSLAYYLLEAGGWDITIIEKQAQTGGNCRTFQVKLSDETLVPLEKPIHRWADMGVNDYNKSTYKHLNELMTATGYEEGLPLEDSEAYGNSSGTVCYTNDGKYFSQMSSDIARDATRFEKEAYQDLQKKEYAYYTLGDYVTEKKYLKDFIFNNLYPRVNGMYFCAGAPEEMPFAAVMSYYSLQEGFGGTAKPDRRYFKGGTQSWIDSLVKKIHAMAGYDLLQTSIESVIVGWSAHSKPTVTMNGLLRNYDAVVLAMHADDAIKSFGGSQMAPPEVLNELSRFEYITDVSVAHTDSRVLHPQVNTWRTYNIHVYDFQNLYYGPYTITYVGNRHQNDSKNPVFNRTCENPQFLISVNPAVNPNSSDVLLQLNGEPASVGFRHQKLTLDTLRAQALIKKLQGKYGLYYANGYTIGAGLHEECIINSLFISQQMIGKPATQQFHFNHAPDADQFAPDYIVNAHKNIS